MRRNTWVLAGVLVFLGLLLLAAAGLGLHSRSMMGMMGTGTGMMSVSGMMWTMRLWGVFVLLIFFGGLMGLFIVCYRLINHGSRKCPNCQSTVQANWTFCPDCGFHLARDAKY